MNFNSFSWLHWNPPKFIFTVPLLDRPIAWYGVLFIFGFFLGYLVFLPILTDLLKKTKTASSVDVSFIADRLLWFIVLGTIIGARIGHVLFYDWAIFREHPTEIFKIWNGGLASHGGTIGVFIALFFFTKYIKKWVPGLTFLCLMDCVVIPTALAVSFIRLGNFVNQEILGIPSTVPWAIIFENPADGNAVVPRHPVQLYEAFCYFVTFVIMYGMWKKGVAKIGSGLMSGMLFVLIFSSRFVIEFWKESQSSILDTHYLQAGQWLSIPFILFGFYLIFHSKTNQLSIKLN